MLDFLLKKYPRVLSAVCLVLIAPWILGAPGGSGGRYADAWSLGFNVLWTYPLGLPALGFIEAAVIRLSNPEDRQARESGFAQITSAAAILTTGLLAVAGYLFFG